MGPTIEVTVTYLVVLVGPPMVLVSTGCNGLMGIAEVFSGVDSDCGGLREDSRRVGGGYGTCGGCRRTRRVSIGTGCGVVSGVYWKEKPRGWGC